MGAITVFLVWLVWKIMPMIPHSLWPLGVLAFIVAMGIWVGCGALFNARLVTTVFVALTGWFAFKGACARQRRVSEILRDRWLCIWSTDDEAIASLRASMHLQRPKTPRIFILAASEELASGAVTGLVVTPFTWAYNRLIAPALDALVWNSIRQSLQGADRVGWFVSDVSHAPTAELETAQPLPLMTSDALRKMADSATQAQAPKLRSLLAQFASSGFGILSKAGGEVFTGKELVHTSYFDNEDVRSLIAFHIGATQRAEAGHEAAGNPYLDSWYATRQREPGGVGTPLAGKVSTAD